MTRGYKSVSLVDVAAAAGVTKGGIYHYFSSKDELLQTAFSFFLNCIEKKYEELLHRSASCRDVLQVILVGEGLENYIKELLGVNIRGNIDYVHFVIEVMRRFPEFSERIRESQALLCGSIAAKLEQAVAAGEIRKDMDAEALAVILLTLQNGHGFQPINIKQRMLDSVWRLLQA